MASDELANRSKGDPAAVADRLRSCEFEIEGRMPYSSNGTFLVTIADDSSGAETKEPSRDADGQDPKAGQPEDDKPDSDKTRESDTTASSAAKSSAAQAGDVASDAVSEGHAWDEDFSDDDYEDDDDDLYYEEPDGQPDGKEVDLTDGRLRGIYKPLRSERPLWDFPEGLYRREVATYEMSAWLGWDIIPTTVLVDGPLGVGSLQRFVAADFSRHYFNHLEDEALHPQLQTLCALDLLTNQTDRKGGHCLIDTHDQIWGIDNGLSFHAEFKVRTVIWDFAGEPIADSLLEDLARLVDNGVPDSVAELVGDKLEQDALLQRARALIDANQFPYDRSGRRYPWPMI